MVFYLFLNLETLTAFNNKLSLYCISSKIIAYSNKLMKNLKMKSAFCAPCSFTGNRDTVPMSPKTLFFQEHLK